LQSERSAENSAGKKDKSNDAKVLNKKLMDECIMLSRDISKNSYTAVKISKMLINKATDTDIETGLRLEIYGWALSFSHEDRHKMMSAFLNKGKK
jgi:3-hydroxypropionyl-coenzyme A dehydratase